MRKPSRFRPAAGDELEPKRLLSSFGGPGPAAQVRSLGRIGQAGQPVMNQIHRSFDRFVQDFTQARGVYLSILSSGQTDAQAQQAFRDYTRYRVDLLGQELSGVLLNASAKAARGSRHDDPVNFSAIVARRINGPALKRADEDMSAQDRVFRDGTLGRALRDSVPAPGTSPQAASLVNLGQDQAIEASRLAVLNGFNAARRSLLDKKSD